MITGDDGEVEPSLYELIVQAVPEFAHASAWMDDYYRQEQHWGVAGNLYNMAVDAWREGRAELLRRIFNVVEVVCAGDNSTFENAMCLDFVQPILGTEAMGDFVPLLGPAARKCYEAKVRYLRQQWN